MNISSLYSAKDEIIKSIEIGLKNGSICVSSTEVNQFVSSGGCPYTESVFDLSNGIKVHVYYFTNYTGMDLVGNDDFFSTENHLTINRILLSIGKCLTESLQ